ncbi:hypothetical protein [Lichenifustis flavocetrariae]|uniref:PEP-CTERM sorting domain-containing protein n=1 Tax=Lichenifustis flavocetrariae TaxID=2949735 RepID=A0AA41Z0Z8_9HYPH|nr:hypothetical protein [Lichenifustis flavocetrariae]MCW6510957.1 hypothetical protein [Lichenifustis flavocetrariae]
MKRFGLVAFVLSLGLSSISQAATQDFTVQGTAGPWSLTANPLLDYGVGDNTVPTIISSGFDFSAGSTFTIGYISGFTQTNYLSPTVDGIGDLTWPVTGYMTYPSFYYSDLTTPSYLQELVGAFATSGGTVIGNLFAVHDGGTFVTPAGASELLLGINDRVFVDNLGSLTVSVSDGTPVSPVPVPTSLPMFGGALLALGALAYRKRLRDAL